MSKDGKFMVVNVHIDVAGETRQLELRVYAVPSLLQAQASAIVHTIDLEIESLTKLRRISDHATFAIYTQVKVDATFQEQSSSYAFTGYATKSSFIKADGRNTTLSLVQWIVLTAVSCAPFAAVMDGI